jgi:hypothetical protein
VTGGAGTLAAGGVRSRDQNTVVPASSSNAAARALTSRVGDPRRIVQLLAGSVGRPAIWAVSWANGTT